jgi:large subunit ribosomal protein L33
MREVVVLECKECGRRDYSTYTDKKKNEAKLELKKYCKVEKKRTLHKQVK